MLTRLKIEHFALITTLTLDFDRGLTIITGETGAGKSMILAALQLALGARAESKSSKRSPPQAHATKITAYFQLTSNTPADQWLKAHGWIAQAHAEQKEALCILHREISPQGRSYASINAKPCTLQHLRTLSEQFIHQHQQHQQQQLMQQPYQRERLDQYAQLQAEQAAVSTCYQAWQEAKQALEQSKKQGLDQAQTAWLAHQYQELHDLLKTCGTFDALQNQHQLLSHATQQLEESEACLQELDADTGLFSRLHQLLGKLDKLPVKNASITRCIALLQQASIHLSEATDQLRDAQSSITLDPEALADVEHKLSQLHDMARRHRCAIEALPVLQETLLEQSQQGEEFNTIRVQQETACKAHAAAYHKQAKILSEKRKQSIPLFAQKITQCIQKLGMPHAQFDVALESSETAPKQHGYDTITFLIAPNPGHPPKALHHIASGGERSRLSLATAITTVPIHDSVIFLFDEVDVGVSAAVGERIGALLKQLSKQAQVICVTHLAQVALHGDAHWIMQKEHPDVHTTQLTIQKLKDTDRVKEIERMRGGLKPVKHHHSDLQSS